MMNNNGELKTGMTWKKLSSAVWEAAGRDGKFRIERSGARFWAHYASEYTAFKMPPKTNIREAKAMCENNEYWEERLWR